MNTHADKTNETKSNAVANGVAVQKGSTHETVQLEDNRPEAIEQRKIQDAADNSQQVKQLKAVNELANNSRQAKQLRAVQAMANGHTYNTTQLKSEKETIQRQVHGNSDDDVTPWDLLGEWVGEEMFSQFTPTIRRRAIGGGVADNAENYNIEFTWAGTYFYNGDGYNVVAHLHVVNGVAVAGGGGIWTTGINGNGGNWNTLAGHDYLFDFMAPYVE